LEQSNPTAKTLSKRAAEAWKQLTASDKERYKALAEKEREEHARIYPHYRFRPMRRQVSGIRKRPCELSKSNSSRQFDSSDEKWVPVSDGHGTSQDVGGTPHPDTLSIFRSCGYKDASASVRLRFFSPRRMLISHIGTQRVNRYFAALAI